MWIANLNFIDFEKGYLQITKRQKELVREIRRMIEESKDEQVHAGKLEEASLEEERRKIREKNRQRAKIKNQISNSKRSHIFILVGGFILIYFTCIFLYTYNGEAIIWWLILLIGLTLVVGSGKRLQILSKKAKSADLQILPEPSSPSSPSLSNPHAENININLFSAWCAKVINLRPQTNLNFGGRGEGELIDQLRYALGNRYICIHGLRVAESLDVDVLLVGPSGIWILESKYLNGEVTLVKGKWTQKRRNSVDHREYQKYSMRFDGPLQESSGSESPVTLHSIDQQWEEEKRCIRKILQNNLDPELYKKVKGLKGGVVFTHPQVILNLDHSIQCKVGTLDYWLSAIVEQDFLDLLSQREIFKVMDTLLNSAFLETDHIAFSAVEMAEKVYEAERNRVREQVNSLAHKGLADRITLTTG